MSDQIFLSCRSSERRPRQLLSADGRTLLNLWFIPHFSDVLHMFKTLDTSVRRLNASLRLLIQQHMRHLAAFTFMFFWVIQTSYTVNDTSVDVHLLFTQSLGSKLGFILPCCSIINVQWSIICCSVVLASTGLCRSSPSHSADSFSSSRHRLLPG